MKNLVVDVEERHHLWLKWDSLENAGTGIFKLKNPRFEGPVVSDCEPVEDTGFIDIDLTGHYIIIIPKPYIVRLAWEGILERTKTQIKFKQMFILDNDLGHLNKLKNTDSILVNCAGHHTDDIKGGKYTIYFEAMVYKETMEPYDIL